MNFFDNIFDIKDTDSYNVSGLSKELTCINIYDTFIRNNKGVLVVASSTYMANLLYQGLLNYTNKVLFFPMDDFLTSEAIAISPEFKVERISTLNTLVKDSKYIVVTNLMGALRYLPSKKLWESSSISLKNGQEIDRDKLLQRIYDIGYERESIVNGTGKIGVRGYVIDIFPTSCENAVRIEFWGDTIDSIKTFDVETQLTISELDEITIYPFSEFILDKYEDDTIRKQKYLEHYSNNVSILSDYLDNGIICYYDYNTLLSSYSLLVDSIMEYDKDNSQDFETHYMHEFTKINGIFNIYYYHFDDDMNSKYKSYKYSYNKINRYNGDYNLIKNDLISYINSGKTVILCIPNKESAKRIIKYLDIDDIILTSEDNVIDNKINLINKNVYEGFIFNNYVIIGRNDLFSNKDETIKYKSKYKIGTNVQTITNLNDGDYIVHEMFGIGIYRGLETIKKGDLQKDYIKLEYAEGDVLYIPVENIDRISKFTGKEGL